MPLGPPVGIGVNCAALQSVLDQCPFSAPVAWISHQLRHPVAVGWQYARSIHHFRVRKTSAALTSQNPSQFMFRRLKLQA